MIKFHLSSTKLQIIAILAFILSASFSVHHESVADYVPQGGEPPTGRTSTSGMGIS